MTMAMAAAAPQVLGLSGVACIAPSSSSSSVSCSSSMFTTCSCSSPAVSRLRLQVGQRKAQCGRVMVRAVATEESVEEDGLESASNLENLGISPKEVRQYPQGLQKYETMAVLRPDITEDQRLALTQRYEEVPLPLDNIYCSPRLQA